MTTTTIFQSKPDFYYSKEECLSESRNKKQTNKRYKNFNQTHFTAGDEEQFQQYRDATNGSVCIQNVSASNNLFSKYSFFNNKEFTTVLFSYELLCKWQKYSNLKADAVINTFRYIFYKFKKGIFVKIVNNKLRVFLPFSNANFVNEWSEKIKIDGSKYSSVDDFLSYISEMEGRKFNSRNVNHNIDEWYANNCLVRYENPISEGESNVGNVKNMLEELCASRTIPDIEFFINRRDFPILTCDGTEAYNNIWGTSYFPLVSHEYEQYVPILSMSVSERYADILMPTWEDWARIQSYEGKWFPRSCKDYTETFDTPWEDKKPTAVFRGTTTGCGVSIRTNPRLMVSHLSATTSPDENGIPYLDAGITKWNLRPRKLQNEKYLHTIEIDNLSFGLSNFLSPKEQSQYKYVINIDGHVSAYRLSIELSMGSVILLVKSQWRIWYTDLLIPYKHFVPIKEDLSDLIEKIKWCRQNDDKCKKIAKNCLDFFATYLQKKGALDYMQKTLIDLKKEIGVYLYNVQSPQDIIIHEEYEKMINKYSFPEIKKSVNDLNSIPKIKRSYGLLQGVEWVTKKVITEGNFEDVATKYKKISQNKLGYIRHFKLANFSLAVKTTSDIQKIKEHIHEAYIGTHALNQISKFIPNFAFIFGLYRRDDTFNVVTEFINGKTLCEYINSEEFSFQEFLFIILQLSLAIEVAQKMCGFVHYDLTPWNIILKRLSHPVKFDYILGHNRIIRISTSVVPVIIDFGKSHVIDKGVHHGFINMFRVSTIQDMITLLLTSMYQILKLKSLTKKDFKNLLHLSNFFSGNKYRKNPFTNGKDLRAFLKKARKYSELINSNKHELEKFVPYDIVKYIVKMSDYKFQLGTVTSYKNIMNLSNGRQVFEYAFAKTTDERIETYINVFSRLKHCTLPQPKNLFFVYYVVQSLYDNLVSVNDDMMAFLRREQLDISEHEKLFTKIINFLHKVYQEKIDNMKEKNVTYKISNKFDVLIPAKYTEESFLVPEKIVETKVFGIEEDEDLSDYKEIVEMILLHQGKYQLRDKDRSYYLKNFKSLLETSSLNMKNNSANMKTFLMMKERIYTQDRVALEMKLLEDSEGDCTGANKYLDVYKKI